MSDLHEGPTPKHANIMLGKVPWKLLKWHSGTSATGAHEYPIEYKRAKEIQREMAESGKQDEARFFYEP
jgi:hypothetical protein